MAYVTDHLHSTGSVFSTEKWVRKIESWLRARIKKHARKQDIRHLLTHNDRLLDDMGLSRAELVDELGYDPGELPGLYRLGAYRMPGL
ncbi:MAG: DUF1127 domain-containing protein [Hyphomicrobiaceae bacterium]